MHTAHRAQRTQQRESQENWPNHAPPDAAIAVRCGLVMLVKHIGSLVSDCPLRYEYDEGVEVRSVFPTEQLEERDGYTVVTDVGPDGIICQVSGRCCPITSSRRRN